MQFRVSLSGKPPNGPSMQHVHVYEADNQVEAITKATAEVMGYRPQYSWRVVDIEKIHPDPPTP